MTAQVILNDGRAVSVSYTGAGSGSAVFSSSTNEGVDASAIVTFAASPNLHVQRTLIQIGMREPFMCSDGSFLLNDNTTFNVLKS